MIICPKCKNSKAFVEVLVGGFRREVYEQAENGRFSFVESDASKVNTTEFECYNCGYKLNSMYKKFLEQLFEPYDPKKHGP